MRFSHFSVELEFPKVFKSQNIPLLWFFCHIVCLPNHNGIITWKSIHTATPGGRTDVLVKSIIYFVQVHGRMCNVHWYLLSSISCICYLLYTDQNVCVCCKSTSEIGICNASSFYPQNDSVTPLSRKCHKLEVQMQIKYKWKCMCDCKSKSSVIGSCCASSFRPQNDSVATLSRKYTELGANKWRTIIKYLNILSDNTGKEISCYILGANKYCKEDQYQTWIRTSYLGEKNY